MNQRLNSTTAYRLGLLSLAIFVGFSPRIVCGQSREVKLQAEDHFQKRCALEQILFTSIMYDNALEGDLMLSEEQIAKVKILQQECSDINNDYQLTRQKGLGVDEESKLLDSIQRKQMAFYERGMQEMEVALLPHQFTRLNQLALQKMYFMSNGNNPIGILLGVRTRLDMPSDQATKLEETIKKSTKEFEDELAVLRKKYLERVIGKLPAKAQQEFKQLFGEINFLDQ